MSTAQQTMDGIESRRLQLEESVDKLRKALDHWSTWEIEYQILKEELQAAGSPSPAQMVEIGRDMEGKLVNEKEVADLLGKETKRTANQVIDMISRRLDYVQQNREKVEKQFDKAQKQLEGFELLTDQGLETEEGLPMMDIEEQLDDDDNVISRSVSQPGKVAPELVEALRKAGVNKAEGNNASVDQGSDDEPTTSSGVAASKTAKAVDASMVPKPNTTPATKKSDTPITQSEPISKGKDKTSVTPKKSVSFANDVQVETFEKPKTLQDDVRNWNLKPGSRVYEIDEDTEEIIAKAVVPSDTPEEAALRREMLQYGLSEVNDVVAELELEDEEGDTDDYDEDDSEDDEEEDQYGRSTRRMLSDDYVKEMRELEQKLNARMMENVGPNSKIAAKPSDARTLRVREDDEFEASMTTAAPDFPTEDASKKGVRFADKVDESEASPSEPSVPIKLPPTIADTIVERAPSIPRPPSTSSKPTKVSRFKSNRAPTSGPQMLPTPPVPEPPPVPTGPSGRVLATSVAEHTPHDSEPKVPDELDPIIHNRQITAEYHKLRNKMISQQGGFKPSEEDEHNPLMEERNGVPKKVSRFKAAKLKAEGL